MLVTTPYNAADISIVTSVLNSEAIPFEIVYDKDTIMKASNGKLNPAHNYAAVRPMYGSSPLLFNVYDTVSYILNEGLKRC